MLERQFRLHYINFQMESIKLQLLCKCNWLHYWLHLMSWQPILVFYVIILSHMHLHLKVIDPKSDFYRTWPWTTQQVCDFWLTLLKPITKYQIAAINNYWEKCYEHLGTNGRTEEKQYIITKFVSILYTYIVINNYFLFLQSLNRYYWRGQWCWWWFWRWRFWQHTSTQPNIKRQITSNFQEKFGAPDVRQFCPSLVSFP
jgi:hypothetical protein